MHFIYLQAMSFMELKSIYFILLSARIYNGVTRINSTITTKRKLLLFSEVPAEQEYKPLL